MVESDITTRITVTKNTSQLDGLKGVFPTLDNIVDNLETRLDTACDNLAQRTAVQLLEYERMEFNHLYRDWETDRKSTRLNSSHSAKSRMPSSA